MEVGTKIKIIETRVGCYGACGKIGVVTRKPHTDGLLARCEGYNVDVGNGEIWRINSDARVKILSAAEPLKMGDFSDHTLAEILKKCRVADFTAYTAGADEKVSRIVVTYVPEEV